MGFCLGCRVNTGDQWRERNVRHHGHGDREEEERGKREEPRKPGHEAVAEREDTAEEGEHLEEEGQQEEDPGEAPHVPVVVARCAIAVLADEVGWGIGGVGSPGEAERQGRVGAAAVCVVKPADLEVGPLRDVSGALDAGRVGAEEVGLSQGRRVGDAREDDEPEEELGAGEEEERQRRQG